MYSVLHVVDCGRGLLLPVNLVFIFSPCVLCDVLCPSLFCLLVRMCYCVSSPFLGLTVMRNVDMYTHCQFLSISEKWAFYQL